jgi:hypothetical protein
VKLPQQGDTIAARHPLGAPVTPNTHLGVFPTRDREECDESAHPVTILDNDNWRLDHSSLENDRTLLIQVRADLSLGLYCNAPGAEENKDQKTCRKTRLVHLPGQEAGKEQYSCEGP